MNKRKHQESIHCEHCARTSGIGTIEVEPLRGGGRRKLRLCHPCRRSPGATWRLRYRPATPGVEVSYGC